MRFLDTCRFLVGSVAVYLGVAACSGEDGLTPDAGAAEPEVYTVACDKSTDPDATGFGTYYAEAIVPGGVSSVVASGRLLAAPEHLPPGYANQSVVAFVGDQRVAAICGIGIPGATDPNFQLDFESITFVVTR